MHGSTDNTGLGAYSNRKCKEVHYGNLGKSARYEAVCTHYSVGIYLFTIWVYNNENGSRLGRWAQLSKGDTGVAGLTGRSRQTSTVR